MDCLDVLLTSVTIFVLAKRLRYFSCKQCAIEEFKSPHLMATVAFDYALFSIVYYQVGGEFFDEHLWKGVSLWMHLSLQLDRAS